MRRWQGSVEGPEFYRHLERGFDLLAPSYDEDIGTNLIGRRMRGIFRRALLRAVAPRSFVFEIGCGSGIDAIWLASRGMRVVATDVSQEMISQVRQKAAAQGLANRVTVKKCAAREIGLLTSEFGSGTFDGGYCHAGALNMEPELTRVPAQVRSLLRPGAPFVCSVINKTSLFELLFYPTVLRPRKAFRRLDNVVPIPLSRREPMNRLAVPTRFYSPNDIVHLFSDGFSVERIQGMQVFLPPSNLTEEYAAAKVAFAPLEFLEDHLADRWPVNHWGHHTLFTFRRM